MAQPFANVTFPLTGHDLGTLSAFSLRQAEYEHEHAVLTLNASSEIYPDLLTGSPVIVEWGTADRAEVFTGYIVLVKSVVVPAAVGNNLGKPGGFSIEAHAVGATFPMREARQTVYSNMTSDKIVARIANNYQLSVFAQPNDRVWANYTQPGQSDWSLLTQLAHDVGYTIYPRNTELRFHSRLLEMKRAAPSALIYDFAGTGTNSALPNTRSIISFMPTVGDVMSADGTTRARRVIGDVDRRNKSVILAQDAAGPPRVLGPLGIAPIFTEFVNGFGADSINDAVSWLSDMGEDRRWYICASAVVQGDTRIMPAHPIYFRGLPRDLSGYWFVKAVTHELQLAPGGSQVGMQASAYTATLDIGRDGIGENVGEPTSLPIRLTKTLQDLQVPRESLVVTQLTTQGYWRAVNS